MSIYDLEKKKFSSLQSNFHKLLNNLNDANDNADANANANADGNQADMLIQINNLIEILESKIIDFNEKKITNNQQQIDNINKNNKVIRDLTPFFIMYRFLID